jgi:hypothetical protein
MSEMGLGRVKTFAKKPSRSSSRFSACAFRERGH